MPKNSENYLIEYPGITADIDVHFDKDGEASTIVVKLVDDEDNIARFKLTKNTELGAFCFALDHIEDIINRLYGQLS